MMRILKYLKNRGFFFPLNLCVVYIIGFLLTPLLQHQSAHPLLFTFGIKYLLFLTLVSVPLLGFLVFTFVSGSRTNRNVFLAVLFIFTALECSFRILRPQHVFDIEPYYYPKPYVMFTSRPNSEVMGNAAMCDKGQKNEPLRFGDLGFRIENGISMDKPRDEYRILMIGGSTVVGGVPLSNSIPSQLELQLHRAGFARARVYNFGVVSWMSGQELSLLLHTLVDYHPDLVIAYDGGNDIFQPYKYDPRPDYPFNFVVFEQGFDRMRGKGERLDQWLSRWLHKSRVIQILSREHLTETVLPVNPLREKCGFGSREWEARIVDAYVRNLEKMCVLADGFGFKIVFILQPTAHFKTPLVGNEPRLLGTAEFQDYMRRQYALARERLKELDGRWGRKGTCFFFDMSRVMEEYPRETFWDFIHTDNAGNRFLAGQIAARMLERRILPRNPASSR